MSQITNQNSTSNQSTSWNGIAGGPGNELSDWLQAEVPETIRHSIVPVDQFGYESGKSGKTKRQAEFNAGRFCAQQALSTWNQDGPVGQADDRSPIWPDGFAGSISHSKNWVWASAAKTDQILSVGVDTETIVDATTRSQTWKQIATIDELRTLQSLDLDPTAEFTVLFSAKEAFYKCLYPVSKQYFGFRDAIVEACQRGQLTIRTRTGSPVYKLKPKQLTVQYFVDSTDVFTVTWMTKKA